MENNKGGIKRLSLEKKELKSKWRMLPANFGGFLKQLGTDVGEVVILDSTSGQVGEKNQWICAEDTGGFAYYIPNQGWSN